MEVENIDFSNNQKKRNFHTFSPQKMIPYYSGSMQQLFNVCKTFFYDTALNLISNFKLILNFYWRINFLFWQLSFEEKFPQEQLKQSVFSLSFLFFLYIY